LKADLHWDDPSNSFMGVIVRVERTERLGEGFRAIAVPGSKEVR